MDRYRRGMPLEGRARTPLYYNGEFPDIKNMDLSEIDQLRKAVAKEVSTLQRDLQQQEEDRVKEEQQKQIDYVRGLEEKLKAIEAK